VESPSHCCDTKIITIVFSDRSMRHGSLTMTSIHTFRAPPQEKGTYMYQLQSSLLLLSYIHQSPLTTSKTTTQPQHKITMPHSKTPGGSGISDKEAKRQAESTSTLTPLCTISQKTDIAQSTARRRPPVRHPLPPTLASPTLASTTAATSPERRVLVVSPSRLRLPPTPT